MDGVEVSVLACFIKTCQCQLIGPSFVFEGRSHEYHSLCVLASSISLMGVIVWHDVWKMVEQSVVWWREDVTTSVVVWWIEKGEMWVWKAQSDKCKKIVFSLKQLSPFFPQTLSFPVFLLLCHHPLFITDSTSFSSTTHVHIHNEHNSKPTQHPFPLIMFLSCSKRHDFNNSTNNDHTLIVTLS